MAPRTYPLPGDEVYPEGVAYQPSTGDFYVGSTSDGAVFRGNVSEPGTEAETFLAPGENGRAMAIGMKVDEAGMLFVAGGETGRMFVYDTSSGQLVDRFSNGADQTFVNDVALAPDGSAYFTDSANPELYRLVPTGGGYEFERFLDFEGTPIVYDEEFNLNGIVVTPDGRYLITIKSPTGQLFRIDTRTEEIVEIDTGDADLSNGDGLLLEGQTLYVVRNQNELIVPVELSADLTSGTAGEGFTNDSLRYPTTIAAYDGRLLAVNSQFDVRDSGGNPDLPFSVYGHTDTRRAGVGLRISLGLRDGLGLGGTDAGHRRASRRGAPPRYARRRGVGRGVRGGPWPAGAGEAVGQDLR